MAKDRDRQPEMDYYELRRRREQILNERARKRPEWDVPVKRPVRTAARRTEPAPTGPVKTATVGAEVFPPKQTPLVRNPIQVPQPTEEDRVAPASGQPEPMAVPETAAVERQASPVPEAPAAEWRTSPVPETPAVERQTSPVPEAPVVERQAPPVPEPEAFESQPAPVFEPEPVEAEPEMPMDIPADVPEPEAAYDVPADDAPAAESEPYEDEDAAFDDAYVDVTDEDMVDENIGNHPFTPFFRFAGNVANRVSGMRQRRAEKAQAEGGGEKPKKQGLKGLFGRKKTAEVDWDELPEDSEWQQEPLDEGGGFEAYPEADATTEAYDGAAVEAYDEPQPEEAYDGAPVEAYDEPQPEDVEGAAFDVPVNGTLGVSGDGVFDDDHEGAEETFGEHHFDDAPLDEPEVEKKKFSLRGLFGRKKPKNDEALLEELEGFDDDDFDDVLDDGEQPVDELTEAEFNAAPAQFDAPEAFDEPEAADDGGFGEPEYAGAEEESDAAGPEPFDGEPADAQDFAEPVDDEGFGEPEYADGFGAPEYEDAEPELPDDDLDEPEDWEEDEAPKKPAKSGFFARFRRGGRRDSDADLLAMLGDDDDEEDEDWDEEDDPDGVDESVGGALPQDEPYSPEPDEELFFFEEDGEIERRDDMNEKDLIASQMSEGIGERVLSRKERRELAERLAAEKAAQAAPEIEPEAPKPEPKPFFVPDAEDDDVDEPTRAFKPVRPVREAPVEPVTEQEQDDYDLFEVEQEEAEKAARKAATVSKPAPKKEKKSKKYDDDDDDFGLFDDDDDEDEDEELIRRRSRKKPARRSRYDDDDDDDFDDDDDDYDDDDEAGGGFLWGFLKAILTIVVILAAAIIVLNVLSSRGVTPATKAITAIADVLPAGIGDKLFPGAASEDELTVEPTEEPLVAPTE
ncbi:MAG: hypothetical protein Q4E13_11125, partial [Clostridia bacterium]|nr:hypothetical protein [Clostridia bacterium]